MASRSEAQKLRRERERRERRQRGYLLREKRKASRAGTNRTISGDSNRRVHAQNVTHLEHGQTDGSLYRETAWRNGSEYVCLVCRFVSGSPAMHETHAATAHFGCEIEVKWRGEPRYYEGAGLVPDFRRGFNVWRTD